MNAKYKIILILVLCSVVVIIASCSINKNEVVTSYESQLYASLAGYFNYYYSMDLWNFQQVLEKMRTMDNDSPDKESYLVGNIDSILSYSEIYVSMTYNGQYKLKQKIISDDMHKTISSYIKIKREYLCVLKEKFNDLTIHIDEDTYIKYEELKNNLQNLNISIENIDEEEEKQYINEINTTIQLIKELKDSLD